MMKKYICVVLIFVLMCLSLCSCDNNADIKVGKDGYWIINGERTAVLANDKDDKTNPQGLEFSLQPDGSYHVGAGMAKYLSKIVIPETYNGKAITGISYKGFYNCPNLVEVVVFANIVTIGQEGFAACRKLENIDIFDNVVSIGDAAFDSCSALKEVRLGEGTVEIGISAFSDCKSLETVYFPKSITSVGNYAFSSSNNVKNVYYSGSKEEWSRINPFTGTQSKNITFHYDYEY